MVCDAWRLQTLRLSKEKAGASGQPYLRLLRLYLDHFLMRSPPARASTTPRCLLAVQIKYRI